MYNSFKRYYVKGTLMSNVMRKTLTSMRYESPYGIIDNLLEKNVDTERPHKAIISL